MSHTLSDKLYDISLVQREVVINYSSCLKVIEVYFLWEEFFCDLDSFGGIKHNESIPAILLKGWLHEGTCVGQLKCTSELYLLGSLIEYLLRNSDGD